MLKDHQSFFIKAAFNSLLPEFMDSDSTHLNDHVSPEFIAVMRKVADHYYGSPEITAKHIANAKDEDRLKELESGQISYGMINDLFKQSAFYGTRNYEGIPTDIKLTLGRFHLTKDPETRWYKTKAGSYHGRDIYDFASNAEYLKKYAPEVTETLMDMGVPRETIYALYDHAGVQLAAGVAGSVMQMSPHSAARMFGGIFMSDKKHLGQKADPSKDGTQFVTFDIPAEDAVAFERPSPRPLWFEDENIEPVFPNTPMDEERKGLLDSFLANFSDIFVTEAQAAETSAEPVLPISKPSPQTEQAVPDMMSEDTTPDPVAKTQRAEPKQMELPVSPPEREQTEKMSFNEAFASNRAAGNKTFTWRGNEYTTEIA